MVTRAGAVRSIRAIGAVDSSTASSESHSTQISLLPPPRCMETTSACASEAKRARPPGMTR